MKLPTVGRRRRNPGDLAGAALSFLFEVGIVAGLALVGLLIAAIVAVAN
jgi:hypothetical protein